LIELLVVMTIVALLVTIALPRYFGHVERSKEAVLKENLKVMRITIDKFYADRGRYPDGLDELVTLRYLRAIPTDPMTETATSWMTVPTSEGDGRGISDVRSGAQGHTSDGLAFDQL
jgi:general secretion pathway protein G